MILRTFDNSRCELDVWGTGWLPKVQTPCIFVPQCTIGCEDGGDDFVCLADEDGIAEIKIHSKRHGNAWIRGILFEHLLLLNLHRASTVRWMPGCGGPPKAPMCGDT